MNDLPSLVSSLPPARTDLEWREWATLLASKGKAELAQYHSLKAIVEDQHKAASLAEYFRQVIQDEQHKQAAVNELKELQLWQQREIGRWLATMDTRGDGRPKETVSTETVLVPSLNDLGVSRVQAHRWQTIATLPEPVFEAHVAKTKAGGRELTSAGVYKLAKDEAKEAVREAKRQAEYGPLPEDTQLCCGTFQEWGRTIPDASVDLILTDPPYGEDWLPQMDDLGAMAARVLRPGGSLIFMYGEMWHYEAETLIRQHLTYQWEQCYKLHGQGRRIDARRTQNHWRPIYWFINGHDTGKGYIGDFYKSEQFPAKEDHDWQQSKSVFRLLVKLHTSPGDLILDPCVGSGPSGVAAVELRRRFIGIDLDPGNINITKGKLAALTEADKLAAETAVNTLIAEMELDLR